MNDPDIFKERKEKCVSTPYGEVCFNHDSCTAFGYQCLLSSDNFTSEYSDNAYLILVIKIIMKM